MTHARRTFPLFAAFLLAAGHAAAQQSLPRFTEVVREHFTLWDLDGDGTLSLDEIDSWASRADLAGHQAAAMATIKAVARSTRWTLPPLTHEYLVDGIEPTQADADDSDAAFDGSAGPASGRPPFESRFRRATDRIRTTPRALFAREEPSLASLRQGPLGSCFLIAPVGAFVARDPALTYRLFIQHQDGAASMRIRSADQSLLVRIDPITDADIALSSTSGRDGAWMPAIEKAWGSHVALRRPEDQRPLTPTDAIARGGSSGPIIEALTGHRAMRIPFRLSSRPATPSASALSPQEALFQRVHKAFADAAADSRLVVVSTPAEVATPGVPRRHAYALIAYDADTHTATLWNPHSNTFTPKGEPGLEHGYHTRRGRFDVPLADMLAIFGSAWIETHEPIGPATQPRPIVDASAMSPGTLKARTARAAEQKN
ncbi:MAG: hypothetical protein KF859_10230 [Phycisphaeraceae bacterium]|nr:hypothetical protein [Phycisphaeraceae bacterium]